MSKKFTFRTNDPYSKIMQNNYNDYCLLELLTQFKILCTCIIEINVYHSNPLVKHYRYEYE